MDHLDRAVAELLDIELEALGDALDFWFRNNSILNIAEDEVAKAKYRALTALTASVSREVQKR